MFSVVFLCDLIAKENQNRSKSAESLPLSLPNTPSRVVLRKPVTPKRRPCRLQTADRADCADRADRAD